MTITKLTPDPDPTPATTTHHHPGLKAARHAWIIYFGAMAGLSIDAVLAASVVMVVFDLHELASYAIVVIVGVIAAKAATDAAIWRNSGSRAKPWLALAGVAAIGLALAWLRLSAGVTALPGADLEQYGQRSVIQSHDELPAVVFMLALYATSAVAIYLAALKLFVPERQALRVFAEEREAAAERRLLLEGDEAAIRERLGYRSELERLTAERRTQALGQVAAREAYLKAFARDAIARAVARPDATPLVRAPHASS